MPSKTQGRQRPSLKDTAQACSAQREWCSTGRSQRKRQKNGRGNDPPAGSGTLCPGSSQGTDNTPLLNTDEAGEPGKPGRQGMQSCCRPGSVCRTSGTRETIGEDCRSGQKEKPHRRRTKKQRTEFVKEVHFLFFVNCKDFRFSKNAHPGLWGYEGSTSLYRGRKKNVLRT